MTHRQHRCDDLQKMIEAGVIIECGDHLAVDSVDFTEDTATVLKVFHMDFWYCPFCGTEI